MKTPTEPVAAPVVLLKKALAEEQGPTMGGRGTSQQPLSVNTLNDVETQYQMGITCFSELTSTDVYLDG